MINGKADAISFDRRNHAVLLDRTRRDLLAWISPDSIEPFSYLYLDAWRLNKIREGSGDWLVEWLDNQLILSASRRGWRAEGVSSILRGATDVDEGLGKQMEVPTKALKHRGKE